MATNDATSLLSALRSAGLKVTPQRLAIVDCLAGDATHPTAQEVYDRLRDRFPTMSVATVYNTLSALDSIGRCRRLDMGGAIRFDPNGSPHDHAVCEGCGAIRDVAIASQDRCEPEECELSGFRVERVERIYRGVCAQCAAAD
jgi:Fur family peroxide stress response transcriptional regulator